MFRPINWRLGAEASIPTRQTESSLSVSHAILSPSNHPLRGPVGNPILSLHSRFPISLEATPTAAPIGYHVAQKPPAWGAFFCLQLDSTARTWAGCTLAATAFPSPTRPPPFLPTSNSRRLSDLPGPALLTCLQPHHPGRPTVPSAYHHPSLVHQTPASTTKRHGVGTTPTDPLIPTGT